MKHTNIYFRKGRYFYGRMVDGKRRFVNLGTKSLRDALTKADLVKDHPLAHAPAPTGSLMEATARFLDYKGLAGQRHMLRGYTPRSLSTKGYNIKKFARWMPETATATSVKTEHVVAWHNHLLHEEGLTETTAHGYLMTVRAFFRWTVEVAKLRLDNPVKKVELPKVVHVARTDFVGPRDVETLINGATNDDMRFILYCGFDAGLRRTEIIEARRDWFDLSGGVLHVRRGERPPRLREGERPFIPKFGKERTVPLTAQFKAFLRKYLRGREPLDYALMPGVKHGDSDYRYDFRRPFTLYMVKAGFKWVTPHTMRHSFTSNLAVHVPHLELARWLGDSVRVLERHYSHFLPSNRKVDFLHEKN